MTNIDTVRIEHFDGWIRVAIAPTDRTPHSSDWIPGALALGRAYAEANGLEIHATDDGGVIRDVSIDAVPFADFPYTLRLPLRVSLPMEVSA